MGAGNAISAFRATRAIGAVGRASVAVGSKAKPAEAVTEGIYEFVSQDGRIYVGQSKNITRRLAQHLRSQILSPEEYDRVRRVEVLGGKTAGEIAEQTRIEEFGLENLANKRNAIGAAQLLNNHVSVSHTLSLRTAPTRRASRRLYPTYFRGSVT